MPVGDYQPQQEAQQNYSQGFQDGYRACLAQYGLSVQRVIVPASDRVRTCPCNPANGGSGVCGCILGGLTTTC